MRQPFFISFGILGVLFFCNVPANAGVIQVNASDSGWYDNNGSHNSGNTNYIIREHNGMMRNFFTFALPNPGTVTSANLRLWTGRSNRGSVDYTLFDVTTSIADLTANNGGAAGGLNVFNDLGAGNQYAGPITITNANNNSFIDIALNANAISSINSSLGSQFAIAGDGSNGFGDSFPEVLGSSELRFEQGEWTVQLHLNTSVNAVPEPTGFAIWGAVSLLGAGFMRRTR